jgi:uncharacterized membrane protein YdbT with pleckstrin-like domain
MSYVGEVLQPGETVRFSTKLHWIVYVPGLIVLIPGVVIYALAYGLNIGSGLRISMIIAAIILLAIAAALLFVAWFRRWTTEFAVTSRRIIFKRGLIQRKTKEIALDKVESIDVNQSVLGRILDYGSLSISGTGQAIEELKEIAAPITFRNHVTAE